MNLPELSIRRPVTVAMVTLIVVLFGVVSFTKLPIELYPNTSFGEISIIIQARGGIPPTEVENLITKPVEEAVATVSNLEQLLSISKEGESTVVLSFKPGTDMDFAALEVREKFAKIKNKLPREIEKPVIAQFQQGDVPIVIASATSQTRSTEDIRKIVDGSVKEALKRITGVANVEIAGGRERKILIEADQTRLAAYGIPIDEVTSTLGANNLNLLSGEVDRSTDRYLVRVLGEYENLDQIRNIGLKRSREGTIIRVKDVAVVKDSYLEPNEYARLNVQPVVTVYIQKESTKNTIKVAEDVLKELERLKTVIPRDIQLVVTSNQAETIKKNIDNLQSSLLEGIILIILVFFLFLFKLTRRLVIGITGLMIFIVLSRRIFTMFVTMGINETFMHFVEKSVLYGVCIALLGVLIMFKRYRSILVVTIPIPVSVLGTFIFMQNSTGLIASADLTINVMTLFGLALGVGMLVDNSIVVFENILKKREAGLGVREAAIQGSHEMFLTIIAATSCTVIVFLPLLFSGQELQKLYSGMAATIVVSLAISVISAISLVPMMCSRKAFHIEPKEEDSRGSWAYRFKLAERKFLFKSIRYRRRVLIASVLVFIISFIFMRQLGLEYLGTTEQNKFTVFVEMPTGAKLDVSDKMVKRVEEIVKKVPEVKNVSSRIEPWSSKVYVEVVGPIERRRSVNDIIESLREETNKLRPAFIYFQQEEQVGTKEVILEIFGYDYDKLREMAIAIANRVQEIKGLSDTKIRMREGRPEMQVKVNKKLAGTHGLTVNDAANQIHGQMRGFRATVFHTEGKEVETITRLDERYRKTFKDLHKLVLTTKDGDPILLDQVADFKFGLGPSEIWRKDRNRMVQVSANIGKVPLSKVAEQIESKLKDLPLPEDYFWRVGGDYPTLMKTNRELQFMIWAVLILVFLLLASLFESLYQPILIMAAVPLALVGAVFTLYIGPRSVSTGALLGMMMLGGIVVNHSIMLMDRINYYVREKRYSAYKAAVRANQDRLRPILMTMMSTVLGLIPMALDRSEGANLWSPLAMTVIGGVVSSTVLTLMVTPAFYVMAAESKRFLSLWRMKVK